MTVADPFNIFARNEVPTITLRELDGNNLVFPHAAVIFHMGIFDQHDQPLAPTPEIRELISNRVTESSGSIRPVIYIKGNTCLQKLDWRNKDMIRTYSMPEISGSRGVDHEIVTDIALVISRDWKADPMATFTNSPCRREHHLLYRIGFEFEGHEHLCPVDMRYRCHHSISQILRSADIVSARLQTTRKRRRPESAPITSVPKPRQRISHQTVTTTRTETQEEAIATAAATAAAAAAAAMAQDPSTIYLASPMRVPPRPSLPAELMHGHGDFRPDSLLSSPLRFGI